MTDPNVSSREIPFRDAAPPQAIQHRLEHGFMARLLPVMESGKLVYRGSVAVNGATCEAVLHFDAALARTQAYTLQLRMTWPGTAPEYHDYHRKASAGWFDLWTRDFSPVDSQSGGENHPKRYAELAAEALAAEAALAEIGDIQQEILRQVRGGATFSTSHKEGGTTISWRNGRFLRADYGESTHSESFPDDRTFLMFLRQFFEWQTRRGSHGEPAEHARWVLMLRLLNHPAATGATAPEARGAAMRSVLAIFLGVTIVAGVAALAGRLFTHKPAVKLDTFDGRPPQVARPQWRPPPDLPRR